jgi:hypothetical protein
MYCNGDAKLPSDYPLQFPQIGARADAAIKALPQ